MKTSIAILFNLLILIPVFSQQTAFFETTLYFEDAMGNQDSLILGHDPEADSFGDEYDPQFEAPIITEPWDSIFEVRATSTAFHPFMSWDLIWLKKSISYVLDTSPTSSVSELEENNCYVYRGAHRIGIYAKHLPVTISWDQSAFDTSYCRNRAYIATHDHQSWPEPGFWWDIPEAIENAECMGSVSEWVTDLYSPVGHLFRPVMLNNGIQDTVRGVFVGMAGQAEDDGYYINSSHCENLLPVQINNLLEGNRDIKIYPNPTHDLVFFSDKLKHQYKVFDMTGKLYVENEESYIDLSIFKNQLLIILFEKDGQWYSDRIIKME